MKLILAKVLTALAAGLALATPAGAANYNQNHSVDITTGVTGETIVGAANLTVGTAVELHRTDAVLFTLTSTVTGTVTNGSTLTATFALSDDGVKALKTFTLSTPTLYTNGTAALPSTGTGGTNVDVGMYPYVILVGITNASVSDTTNVTAVPSVRLWYKSQ